jgi:hypothetical protein
MAEPTRAHLELAAWMQGKTFASARTHYTVQEIDGNYVVFRGTGSTEKVALPLDLVLEWITALKNKRIRVSMEPRDMRTEVQKGSQWAKQLHSFETHLAAVVNAWGRSHP